MSIKATMITGFPEALDCILGGMGGVPMGATLKDFD